MTPRTSLIAAPASWSLQIAMICTSSNLLPASIRTNCQ
jgi:hypothetical protein